MPAKCAAPRATAHLSQEYRTPAWEQRKLGQHLKLSRELGHTGVDARKLTVKLWGKGVVEKTDLYGGSAQTQYYIRHAGQFMYGKLDFLHAAFGVVPDKLDCFESTLDSPAFDIEGLDSSFLLNLVTQEDFYLKNGNIANGSRKAKRIHEETFLNMEIRAPELVEQRRIGAFLDRLDSLITLHQRKYDKLCVLKKSMLDKMFPKGGSLYPEIRFAGFTDPWEQRKLGDVATIVGGGTPSTNNDAYWDGDIDWYSPAELGEQVYADRSARRITQAGYDSCSATLLPAGKTILFTSRAGIGNTAILRRSACTNQGFQSLVVNDDTDVYFVYSMTDRIKNFAEQKASGSTFLEISGKGLAAGEFAFPSKDEQTAIGSMFKQLDHLITLHQRKLELLRNIKKSMLDKMFV